MKNSAKKVMVVAVMGTIAVLAVATKSNDLPGTLLSAPAHIAAIPTTILVEQLLSSDAASYIPAPSVAGPKAVEQASTELSLLPANASLNTTSFYDVANVGDEPVAKVPGDISSDEIIAFVEGQAPPSGHAAPTMHTAPLLLAAMQQAGDGGDAEAMVTVVKTPAGLTPTQVRAVYGTDKLTNQGEGQTIAIVNAYDNPTIEADLGVFSTKFGLPACTTANGCFTKVYASGTKPGVDPGWALEIALDVQWAHAIAPKAKIILVEARSSSFTDLFAAVKVAVQKGAGTISMSWGSAEFSTENNYNATFYSKNVSFFASSGDRGTSAHYPAAAPSVVSVGGTSLVTDAVGSYKSETAWTGSGGGVSLYVAEPSGQTSWPLPFPGKKGIPDVSCNSDPTKGYSVYSSTPYLNRSGWFISGGTSAAVPQWAAIGAIANSMRASAGKAKLDALNNTLYAINKGQYGTIFNDITAGKNGTCGTRCTAAGGYDYVTGLGTPRVNMLVPALVAQP